MRYIRGIVLLWLAAFSATAQASWLTERVTYNGQILPLLTIQQPVDNWENPENDFFKLERYNAELHLRPNLQFDADVVRMGISPRAIFSYQRFEDGTQDGETDSDNDVFINEAYLDIRLIPSLPIAIERKNWQWGSGFLISPSNPFYRDTGKSKPGHELRGKDFVHLSYIPNDWLSLTAIANIGEGAFETQGMRENFKNVYAFKATLTFENMSLSPVMSYQDEDRVRIGGFGTWTISDAMLGFFDCSFAKGSQGRYVEQAQNDPFGAAFQPSKDDSERMIPQILVGGSYTFMDGTAVYLEYLYYGEGYNDGESDDYNALVEQSAQAYLYRGSDPALQQLARLGTRNLAYANQNRLAFQRRNYLMAYLNRSDIFNKLNVNAGIVHNVDDTSLYFFNFLTLNLYDRINIFSNTIVYGGKKNTEFHSPFNYIETIGLQLFF